MGAYVKKVVNYWDNISFDNFPVNVLVYSISSDDNVVYVGSTNQRINVRIGAHLREAKKGSHLPIHKWIRKNNYKFTVKFLEVATPENRHKIERRWVKFYSPGLLNITDGGPGMSGHKFAGTEHAKRIGSKIATGDNFTCLFCGTEFWRKLKDIKKGHNKYCSKVCYQKSQKGVSKPMPEGVKEKGIAAAAKMRRAKTECRRGHPLSGDNLRINKKGGRVCKECGRIAKRAYISRNS